MRNLVNHLPWETGDTARAYQLGPAGDMTGQVLDVRAYVWGKRSWLRQERVAVKPSNGVIEAFTGYPEKIGHGRLDGPFAVIRNAERKGVVRIIPGHGLDRYGFAPVVF